MFKDYDPEVTKSFEAGHFCVRCITLFFSFINVNIYTFYNLCMYISCKDQVEYYSVHNGSLLSTAAPVSGRFCFKTATLFRVRRNREIESEETSVVRN